MIIYNNIEYIKSINKVFYFSRELLGEEFFGLSIVYVAITIFLFVNACLTMLTFFHLRSNKEISEIKINLITINSLEQNELKFFYKSNRNIETEDMAAMGYGVEEVLYI